MAAWAVTQTSRFRAAVMGAGIADWATYPGENHSFTERAHQIDVVERTRAWFARWLGDPGHR